MSLRWGGPLLNGISGQKPPSYASLTTAGWDRSIAENPKIIGVVFEAPPSNTTPIIFETVLAHCCQQWNTHLSGLMLQAVTPEFKPPASTGIIKIHWQAQPPLEKPYACGWTVRTLENTSSGSLPCIRQARMTLVERPLIDQELGITAQKNRLEATVLHELGHALGLNHVQPVDAVMHRQGWRNTRLTVTDVSALKRLYPH
jgi:Matrixin